MTEPTQSPPADALDLDELERGERLGFGSVLLSGIDFAALLASAHRERELAARAAELEARIAELESSLATAERKGRAEGLREAALTHVEGNNIRKLLLDRAEEVERAR